MQKETGCLLIHGFGGNREEVAPLARRLQEDGYQVRCPALKGHTGKRQDLKGITYQEWITSAEQDLKELSAVSQDICLVGFSMGGLIALNLAVQYDVQGVVTLNSPVYYWDIKRIMLNLLEDLKARKFDNTGRYFQSGAKFPLSAMINFRILLSKTKGVMKMVHCPVFIAQALEDDTVRKSSAAYLQRNIASPNKTLKYYPNAGHLILSSQVSAQVIQDVAEFIQKVSDLR